MTRPSNIKSKEIERLRKRVTFNAQGGKLPDLNEVERKMGGTIKRLTDAGFPIPPCWRDRERTACETADVSKCPAACHRAALFHRCDISLDIRNILAEAEGPQHPVTLVLPQWQRPVGDLASFSVSGAMQKLRSQLRSITDYPVVLSGGFEVSLNRTLAGEPYWQWHVHAMVVGVPDERLHEALYPPPEGRSPEVLRPLLVGKVRSLTRQLAYAMKGTPCARTAYLDETERRRHRGHRLDAAHQRELELFMAGKTADELLITVGIRRVKGKHRPLKRQHT